MQAFLFVLVLILAAAGAIGLGLYFLFHDGGSAHALNSGGNYSAASLCDNASGNGTERIECSESLDRGISIKISWPENNSRIATGPVSVNGTISGDHTSSVLTDRRVDLILDGMPASRIPALLLQHRSDDNVSDFSWQINATIPAGRHDLTAVFSAANESLHESSSISVNATLPIIQTKTGVYIPMYSISTLDSFLPLMKTDGPSLPYVVSINPNSGPGTSLDTTFTSAITTLHSSGLNITVIGYVPTGYGTSRTVANVEGMIDKWYSLYPGIDGIMFDEVDNTPSTDSFYQTITDYARAHGAHFLRGNPGAPIDAGKLGMFDTIAIGESSYYPSESELQADTFNGAYEKARFAYTVHDQTSLDATWLATSKEYVGYIYITDDVEPDPYDTVPSYFGQEIAALSGQ